MPDIGLFKLINSLAGKVRIVDDLFSGLGSDYFLLIFVCLFLVFLWFATRDKTERDKNQRAILITLIGIGIANGLIALCNVLYFRDRPFNELPPDLVNLLFYRPHDSSFPSNFTAALFVIGTGIFSKNKKCGIGLLVIALIGGFARIFVGIHYPLDILGGAAIGVFSGFLAYEIGRLITPVISGMLCYLRKIFLA